MLLFSKRFLIPPESTHDKLWYGDWIYIECVPARSVIASSGCSGSDCFIGRFINVWHGAGDGEHRPQTMIELSRSDQAPCVRVRLDGQWPGRPPILSSKIPEQGSLMFLFIKHRTIDGFRKRVLISWDSLVIPDLMLILLVLSCFW